MTCVSDIRHNLSETLNVSEPFVSTDPEPERARGLDPGDLWRRTVPIARRNCLGSSNLKASRRRWEWDGNGNGRMWGVDTQSNKMDTMDKMEVLLPRPKIC